MAKAAYCMTPLTHTYFGHWLLEGCPTALLARSDEAVCLDLRTDWAHAGEYLRAFSIRPQQNENVFVRELTLFQDYSQGSSKRARYAELRTRSATFYGQPLSVARPVYLRRGQSGQARCLSNEDQLIERLEQRGFLVLDASTSSAAELFRGIAAAPLVVGMEGSHLNHVHFSMAQGGSLLVLIPSDRFSLMHFDCSQAFGLHFAALVVERDGAGYRVDMDELFRTMDLLPL
jgi:capsular polysaccharide biosynthesis protein